MRRRTERRARDPGPDRDFEGAPPASKTGRGRSRPPSRCLLLEDQVSREQAAARLKQTTHQRRGDTERRIGDDVVRAARQTKAARVSLNDHDRVTEALAQGLGSLEMSLNCDDASTSSDQRSRECSTAGADVEDDGARDDARVSDEPLRPPMVELVPSPSPL